MNRNVWKRMPSSALVREAMEHFAGLGEVTGAAAGEESYGWYLRVWFDPAHGPKRTKAEYAGYRVVFDRGYAKAHA